VSKLSDNISRQYAKCFLDVANRQDILSVVLKEVLFLKEGLQTSKEFQFFIKNPLIPIARQQAFFEEFIRKKSLSVPTSNFLKLICVNKRLSYLNKILDDFMEMTNDAQSKIEGTVVSAQALNPNQKSDLEATLGRLLEKQVMLKTVQDPQMLGGLRIQIGSYIFDGSLKHQLDVLTSALEKVSIHGA